MVIRKRVPMMGMMSPSSSDCHVPSNLIEGTTSDSHPLLPANNATRVPNFKWGGWGYLKPKCCPKVTSFPPTHQTWHARVTFTRVFIPTWLTSPCSNPILNHAATGRLIVRGWEYCYSHNFQLRCPLTAEPGRCPQSSGMTPQLAGDLNRRFPLWPSSPACPWCSPYPKKRCRKASIDHDL